MNGLEGAETAQPDTMSQHVWLAEVSYADGVQNVRMRLGNLATREIGAGIAEHYAAGDAPGHLEILGNGFSLHRFTIRDDAFPPPPPLPVAANDDAPQDATVSMTRGLTPGTQGVFDRMDDLLPSDLTMRGPDGREMRVVYLTDTDGTPRC